MSIIKTGISEKKHKIPHKPSEIFMKEPLKQPPKSESVIHNKDLCIYERLEMDIYQGKRYLFNILTKTFHLQKM